LIEASRVSFLVERRIVLVEEKIFSYVAQNGPPPSTTEASKWWIARRTELLSGTLGEEIREAKRDLSRLVSFECSTRSLAAQKRMTVSFLSCVHSK